MSLIPTGAYINNTTPWWSQDIFGTPANIEVSTITVNPLPAGNILLQHTVSSGTEYNAPLIFQRPAADINAPSESLVMNTSLVVPTKPVNGEYITATKTAGTVYDDIAVAGLQVYGNQTTAGNTGAAAYITGSNGNLIIAAQNSVYVSSLFVSTLTATNVISTTATTGTSLTLTSFLSSLSVTSGNVSTNAISTSQIVSKDIFTSTLTVSTLNAPNFTPAQVSTIVVDTKLTLTSTLSLTGSPTNINLGLGNVIQGLIGGAATQALGVGIGGAALITGSVALATGRTSGGVNSNIFQTVNGSTQLQFSTIGSNVSSVFLTVNSPNPLTTPGLEIQQTQGVAAGTYCVRSVGDPLYITNNVSSIQMYGQWVPVIQPTATIPAVAISSLTVSSINGLPPGGGGGGGITSTVALSTATINGNFTQSGTGTFNWGGNTMSGTQVVIARPTAINNTLTTTGAAFLNAGATTNSLTISALGSLTAPGGGTFSWGSLPDFRIQGGVVTVNALAQFNQGAIMSQNLSASGGLTVTGGTVQFNPSVTMLGNLSVVGNGRFSAVSTNTLSTNSITSPFGTISSFFVSSINNAAYPPGSGGGIPSTLNASTINFDGGLNNIGSAPINTTTINTTNANVNFYVGNAINAASISTTTISTNTVFAGSMTTNTINATTVNTNNFQAAAISTNTLSTNIVQAAAISSFMISSANGIITSLNVSSVNGAAYPPGGGGGGGIPSTLNASTINVNGGITIANGGIINNSFEPIRTRFLSTGYISTGLITADSSQTSIIQADSISTNVVRAGAVSTVFLSSQTITASNAGLFQISSLTGSIYTLLVDGGSAGRQGLVFMDAASAGNTPAGNIKAVGNGITTFLDPVLTSYNIQNGYSLGTNRILTLYGQNTSGLAGTAQFFSTLTVCANPVTSSDEACIQTYPPTAPTPVGTVITKAVSTQSMQVSSINGVSIPFGLGVPTGSVMIWGGTTEADPPGYYICDGRMLNISANAALYAVIGLSYYNNYPTPIAPGTFYLPDFTFAMAQGAPKANYNASFVAVGNYQPTPGLVNIMQNVPGVPPAETANRIWKINSMGAGTINVGTLIPGGQYIGAGGIPQTANLYIQSIVKTDPTTGNPLYIAVESVDGSTVAIIPQGTTVNITCAGVYRQPTPPLIQNFWAAGTYNELAFTNPGSNGPTTEAPAKRNVRTQLGVEVGVHTHSYNRYGLNGSSGLVNGDYDPSKSSAFQNTGNPTQNITDNLGNTWAAPYPTKPNVLNMFYIIKY